MAYPRRQGDLLDNAVSLVTTNEDGEYEFDVVDEFSDPLYILISKETLREKLNERKDQNDQELISTYCF